MKRIIWSAHVRNYSLKIMGKIVATMPNLLILSKEQKTYRSIIEAAELPDLHIADNANENCDIILGEPNLIRDALTTLPALKWVQATWAGVEPLLDPSLPRVYILTNARGVFGGLMSEYVLGYLLAHERKIFQRADAQKNKALKRQGLERRLQWFATLVEPVMILVLGGVVLLLVLAVMLPIVTLNSAVR